ncbi:MAG: hypothetical protein FWF59_05950 [Turicibacter sp.]|nr:hypothetical protein [Turicibacter sp.]
MKKCLKCGEAASEARVSVCESCHEDNLHGEFMLLFKENLAKCLFENIADMTYVLDGSKLFLKRYDAAGKSGEVVYQQVSEAFLKLYRAIDYLHREVVKIFHPEADLELLIAINTAGVEEMSKIGQLLEHESEE